MYNGFAFMVFFGHSMKIMRRILVISTACLAAALSLASCGINRKSIRLPAEPVVTVEQEDVSMTLRFLDEPSLRQRFGTSENPFLTDYSRALLRRNVVFELTIRNKGSASFPFELQDCELQYGGKALPPLNRFQQASDVNLRDEDRRLKAPKTALINKYVLPNRTTLASGSMLTGFLLFQGNLPVSGEALVTIPGFEGQASFQFRYAF